MAYPTLKSLIFYVVNRIYARSIHTQHFAIVRVNKSYPYMFGWPAYRSALVIYLPT